MSKSFIKNAGFLAISVIIAKVLGAVYRIPLASMVGAEGMGLYQFVYPVFALLLTLASGAVPNAISITVSEHLANNDTEGASKTFSITLKLCLIIGLSGTLLLGAIAYPISLLQHKDAFIGHLSIAPAILIVTLISAFRGWFMGHSNLIPGSISQITEGTVKLAVGLTLTSALVKFGIKYAVMGALLGVVASELVTLIIMFIAYIIKDKRFARVRLRDGKDTLKRLRNLAGPLILCGSILPISQFIDSVLIVNLLKWGGYSENVALYGVWSGIVTPLINLPVMVCISLGIAVTPKMVEGREHHDVNFIVEKSNTAIKLTFLLGVPFVFFYLFMGKGIINVLYPTLSLERLNTAVTLLQINAVSVLGLSIFQIYSAMLQGLSRAVIPVKIMGLCMVFKLLLSVILVPIAGIIGCAIAAVIGYTASGIWISIYFANFVNLDVQYVKNTSLIAVCGVIMGTVILLFAQLQESLTALIIIAIVAMVVYFLAIMALKVFSEEEMKSMPFSKLLIKLNKKMNGETNGKNT